MPINYQSLCEEVINVAKNAGNFIRTERQNFSQEKVETKSLNSLVSYVDKEAEKIIVEHLSELLPEAGFIAEEGTSDKTGETYNWVIDPLDGTTNFIHGIPCFAVSIALMENDEVVVGVVYEVNLNECFYAWNGSKAYLNGKEITVAQTDVLADTLMATGFPYYDYKRVKQSLSALEFFMKNTRGIRRLGSAATDLAYVAAGRFDGFYEYSLNAWDVAAGALIVQQAGGRVSDFKGENNYIFGAEIVAGSATIFNEFQSVIEKQFNN